MSRSRRWAVASLVALAVAAGGVANAVQDDHLVTGWHTVVRGQEAQDVLVGDFRVHVHGATASAVLDDGGDLVRSAGTWVVVDVAYASTNVWSLPWDVVLVDQEGREYTTPSGFGSGAGTWRTGPDIWFRGTLLYEVPPEAVDSLALEFRPEAVRALVPTTLGRIPLTVATTDEALTLSYTTVLPEGER